MSVVTADCTDTLSLMDVSILYPKEQRKTLTGGADARVTAAFCERFTMS